MKPHKHAEKPWVSFKAEEALKIGNGIFGIDLAFDGLLLKFARAIEAKLKELNHG